MLTSGLLAFSVCALAAYRLRLTPLAPVCWGLALAAAAAAFVFAPLLTRGAGPPRAVTAAVHVCLALGAFLAFVSFSLS